MSKVQKRNRAKRQLRNRCFICLRQDHRACDCKVTKRCFHCGETKKHHQSLCPKVFSSTAGASAVAADCNNEEESLFAVSSPKCLTSDTLLALGKSVLLQTASSVVSNEQSNISQRCRVLLESGSDRSYITVSLAKQLKAQCLEKQLISFTTFSADKPKTIETELVKVCLTLTDGTLAELCLNVVPKITGPIQRASVSYEDISSIQVKQLQLADALPYRTEEFTIDILLGSDYYMDIILFNKVQINNGLYLVDSKLGWLLTGRTSQKNAGAQNISMFVGASANQVYHQLTTVTQLVDTCLPVSPSMEDFWNLETIGIKDSITKSDDERAQDQFDRTVQFANGRYHVGWPYKDSSFELPENYPLALGRFSSVIRKLSRNHDMLMKYDQVIQDQRKNNIIELVNPDSACSMLKHYIPHHPVISPFKATTKIRIVYDAPAKAIKSAKSVNECLLRGPVILENLCGLLLRFRLHSIVLLSDIEKAFLQVGLQQPDRDTTRFLWTADIDKPLEEKNIQVFRFCRVPFGIVSSPFLLSAVVKHHLSKIGSPTAIKIRDNIYVDNVICGVASTDDARKFYFEAKAIFKQASMNLREWASNSSEFLESLPQRDRSSGAVLKVLGLKWNIMKDIISIAGPNEGSIIKAGSKRQILQLIAGYFDPLGFFSPLMLKAKIFLQTLFKEGLDWDDPLSQEMQLKWKRIATDILKISDIQLPRLALISSSYTEVSLHCFCDASTKAYAACVYLRSQNGETVDITLNYSKTRLAPKGSASIPRLEVMAVVIAVKSIKFVSLGLRLPISKMFVWTDSKCVLNWLTSTKALSTFVENRIHQIKAEDGINFRYVRTTDNPADIATRDTAWSTDLKRTFWWQGPSWLRSEETEWPTSEFLTPEDVTESTESETKGPKVMYEMTLLASGKSGKTHPYYTYGINETKYSSLTRLHRVTAWCSRFVARLRDSHCEISNEISSEEVASAKLAWERYIQGSNFAECMKALLEGSQNHLKQQLSLHIDSVGLIRCYGCYENVAILKRTKYPKLLPRNCHYTSLVIQTIHRKLLHAGVNHTLSELRQEYWIPQRRSIVRRTLLKCQVCRRWNNGPYQLPKMPPWPAERVSVSSPFSYSGLDYFGPMFVKDKTGECHKVWVCLFTCLAVRAVHLEVCPDMSTEQFLLVLKRFMAGRGTPVQIICDNASQFKVAARETDDAYKDLSRESNVQSFCALRGISWYFITEFAPWMGGFYERLIGIVKGSLRKSIGHLRMTMVQLQTILAEVEAITNSRPLIYVGDDINSGTTITPAHFLTLNPKCAYLADFETRCGDAPCLPDSSYQRLSHSWFKGNMLLNKFWKFWRDEYLLSVRERPKTHIRQGRIRCSEPPQVGDIVLIKDDNHSRSSWQLGRITELIPSYDGEIRAAKLCLGPQKYLIRPLKLLRTIECPKGSESSSLIELRTKQQRLNNIKLSNSSPNCGSDQSVEHLDTRRQPLRNAAKVAREAIRQCLPD